MSKKVGIVGAGIAGIAASIRLANQGHEVTVFEANDYPGGKLTAFNLGGYRFDAGPSLFTLPEQVVELFQLCGEDPNEHFEYEKLETTCKYFFADGTVLNAWSDKNELKKEFTEKLQEPPENLEKALKNSAFLYEELSPLFMHRSLHKMSTWIGKTAFRAYTKLTRFDFNRTMNEANESHFENPKSVQLFNRYATYNGSDPYQTPATLNIIPHLEFGIGAYFPRKGMHDITMSLFGLAKRQGVQFKFNSPVEKIIVENGKAVGIKSNEGVEPFNAVISNMDVLGTYRRLLKDQKQPNKILEQPRSSSALIFYWGIKKDFKELELHNIFFSEDYRTEFNYIFKQGKIYDDPTVYVNITSTEKKEDAPSGCQNWFTMINVPNNTGQDWDELIKTARAAIIQKLSKELGQDIAELIEVEDVLDPRLIESKTSSIGGSLYGNSSNSKFAAFLRHSNFSKHIKDLYFVGGSVHPGGGIPLCLLSAKIMAQYFD
jgi:phytoene desaturase